MTSGARGIPVKEKISDVDLERRAILIAIAKRKHPRETKRSPSPRRNAEEQQPQQAPEDSVTNRLSLYHSRMLRSSANANEVEEALQRIENMCERNIPPHQDAFSKFVAMLAENSRMAEALDWLRRPDSAALYPSLAGLQPDELSFNALLVAYAKRQEMVFAERLASEMAERGVKIAGRSFAALIRANLELNEGRRAHHWACMMIEAGYTRPSKAMMAELIRALADAGNAASANHWLSFMEHGRGVLLDDSVYEFVRDKTPHEIIPAGLSGEGELRKPLVLPATVAGRPPPPPPLEAVPGGEQDQQKPAADQLALENSPTRSERPTTAGSCRSPRTEQAASPRSQNPLTPRSSKKIPRILVASGGLAMKVGRMEASSWGKAEPRKEGLRLAFKHFGQMSAPTPDLDW